MPVHTHKMLLSVHIALFHQYKAAVASGNISLKRTLHIILLIYDSTYILLYTPILSGDSNSEFRVPLPRWHDIPGDCTPPLCCLGWEERPLVLDPPHSHDVFLLL